MSANFSSAAVVIGALRVNNVILLCASVVNGMVLNLLETIGPRFKPWL